jgi:hypothetical protein
MRSSKMNAQRGTQAGPRPGAYANRKCLSDSCWVRSDAAVGQACCRQWNAMGLMNPMRRFPCSFRCLPDHPRRLQCPRPSRLDRRSWAGRVAVTRAMADWDRDHLAADHSCCCPRAAGWHRDAMSRLDLHSGCCGRAHSDSGFDRNRWACLSASADRSAWVVLVLACRDLLYLVEDDQDYAPGPPSSSRAWG